MGREGRGRYPRPGINGRSFTQPWEERGVPEDGVAGWWFVHGRAPWLAPPAKIALDSGTREIAESSGLLMEMSFADLMDELSQIWRRVGAPPEAKTNDEYWAYQFKGAMQTWKPWGCLFRSLNLNPGSVADLVQNQNLLVQNVGGDAPAKRQRNDRLFQIRL